VRIPVAKCSVKPTCSGTEIETTKIEPLQFEPGESFLYSYTGYCLSCGASLSGVFRIPVQTVESNQPVLKTDADLELEERERSPHKMPRYEGL
jgi:hypothetical protein